MEKEIIERNVDPFYEYCIQQKDNKWEPFGYYDDTGMFRINYKCSLDASKIQNGYKQYQKR